MAKKKILNFNEQTEATSLTVINAVLKSLTYQIENFQPDIIQNEKDGKIRNILGITLEELQQKRDNLLNRKALIVKEKKLRKAKLALEQADKLLEDTSTEAKRSAAFGQNQRAYSLQELVTYSNLIPGVVKKKKNKFSG